MEKETFEKEIAMCHELSEKNGGSDGGKVEFDARFVDVPSVFFGSVSGFLSQ